jgi:hypothetical protein
VRDRDQKVTRFDVFSCYKASHLIATIIEGSDSELGGIDIPSLHPIKEATLDVSLIGRRDKHGRAYREEEESGEEDGEEHVLREEDRRESESEHRLLAGRFNTISMRG